MRYTDTLRSLKGRGLPATAAVYLRAVIAAREGEDQRITALELTSERTVSVWPGSE